MTKLFFGAENCKGATSGLTGHHYPADKQGFIHVNNPADAAYLKQGGYVEAGGMPRMRRFYVCECGWEAAIRHCPKCERDDLVKVER